MKDYSNEKERRKELADLMRQNGWDVYEEVVSDEKNENGRYKFRLDILAKPPKCNFYIGFELKLYDGIRKGGEFFEALKQTLNYREQTFMGNKVELWVIDLYHTLGEKNFQWSDDTFRSSWIFMQSFLQKIGIGMIDEYGKITFMINSGEYIHRIDDPYGFNKTNWNKILTWVYRNKIKIIRGGDE